MSNLLSELDAVVALDQRATPGTVELHTSCSWRRIVAGRGQPFLVPTIDPDRHQNMDTIENAQFVVALVNWFRTHHAEIAADAKDAARYRWLRDHNNVIGTDGFTECPVEVFIDGESHAPGFLDAQVDAAMSALEGQG